MQNSSMCLTNKSIKANPNEAGSAKVDNTGRKHNGQRSIGRNVSGSSLNSWRRRRLYVDEHDSQVASNAGIVTAEEEDDDILSNLELPLVNSKDSPAPSSAMGASCGGGTGTTGSKKSTPQSKSKIEEGGESQEQDSAQLVLIRRILEEIRNAMTENNQQGAAGLGPPNPTTLAAATTSAGINKNTPAASSDGIIDMAMLADPKNWDRLFNDKKAQARLLEVFNDSSEQLPINEVVIPQEDNDTSDKARVSPGGKQWQRRWSMCSDITGFADVDVVDTTKKDVVEDSTGHDSDADLLLSPTPSTAMSSPTQSPKPKVGGGGKAARRRSSRRRSSTTGLKKRNSLTELPSSNEIHPQEELHPSELFPGAEDYMERMGDVMVEARRQSLTHDIVDVADDAVDSFALPPTSERSNTSSTTSRSGNHLRYSNASNAGSSNKLVDGSGVPLIASDRNNLEEKGVDFSTVSIRFYERIISDNPACMQGPPIGIGWMYKSLETRRGDSSRCPLDISIASSDQLFNRSNHSDLSNMKTSKYLYSVQEFEELRHNRRLSGPELVLTRQEREAMLLQWGYTSQDLAKAIRSTRAAQNKRRQTINNLGAAAMEEAMESVSRKVRRMLGFRKPTSTRSSTSSTGTTLRSA